MAYNDLGESIFATETEAQSYRQQLLKRFPVSPFGTVLIVRKREDKRWSVRGHHWGCE